MQRESAAAPAPPLRPAGIKPPQLENDQVVRQLPSAMDDLAVGGGGRYLILHLPRESKLAVFDVNEARIVHYVPVADEAAKFAAGLDKLIVVLPGTKTIERWSLNTFERELAVPMPIKGKVAVLSMGSASQGPLAVGLNETQMRYFKEVEISFLDAQTMKPLPSPDIRQQREAQTFDMCMSADGTVLGLPGGDEGRAVVHVDDLFKVYKGRALRVLTHIMPSPDGQVLVTNEGLFSIELKPVGNNRQFNYNGPMVPAQRGHYYLKFDYPDTTAEKRGRDRRPIITVHMIGDDRPLYKFAELEGLEHTDPLKLSGSELPSAKRIHFIPDAKLIITIPSTQDRLILHRFDVDAALEKSDIDYLFVLPQTLLKAKLGTMYSCQLEVKSRKGGVQCHLENGPPGMECSSSGRIIWQVPADFSEPRATVGTRITDATGQECRYTFTIAIRE